ncbi:translation elongation factor Ts [Candidatus Saganbacteria bacterium]|nr:translation elongation factor Ts [Candidatus Saganbacteria bacterium]
MGDITTEIIVQLREKTGCGMMDCKKALVETKGNIDQAVDLLRQKGLASVAKRAKRVAAQGIINSYIHMGGKLGVLLELNCETDFVAKNSDFHNFAKDVSMQIAAQNPQYITRSEVPEASIEHEKEVLLKQAETEKKPAAAMEKIMIGRLEKFYEEVCLMDQAFIKDPKVKIKDLLGELSAKIGENIVVRRFTRYQLGEKS